MVFLADAIFFGFFMSAPHCGFIPPKMMNAIEPKIQINYVVGKSRPYIGAWLVVNGLNYYAPLSSYKAKQDNKVIFTP